MLKRLIFYFWFHFVGNNTIYNSKRVLVNYYWFVFGDDGSLI